MSGTSGYKPHLVKEHPELVHLSKGEAFTVIFLDPDRVRRRRAGPFAKYWSRARRQAQGASKSSTVTESVPEPESESSCCEPWPEPENEVLSMSTNAQAQPSLGLDLEGEELLCFDMELVSQVVGESLQLAFEADSDPPDTSQLLPLHIPAPMEESQAPSSEARVRLLETCFNS